jgi:hypothetical protein
MLLATLAPARAEPPRLNGFALEPARIEAREILRGGAGRDGIPALDHPAHRAAGGWAEDERVIGVAWNGEARAYPVALLVWHELVNDTLGGRPILVSFCPLCGTGIVFDRRLEDAAPARRFGVSGLLYRSDLLMYDRETESLWSQIGAEAVTGASLGARLRLLRARTESWGAWRRRHPGTTVLTRDTGHRRDYGESPYGDYAESSRLLFPVPRVAGADRYHPKMPTVGLRLRAGAARAYPAGELLAAGGEISERFGDHAVRVVYDEVSRTFRVDAPDPVEVIEGYWFAWIAFHPDTSVARAEPPG